VASLRRSHLARPRDERVRAEGEGFATCESVPLLSNLCSDGSKQSSNRGDIVDYQTDPEIQRFNLHSASGLPDELTVRTECVLGSVEIGSTPIG